MRESLGEDTQKGGLFFLLTQSFGPVQIDLGLSKLFWIGQKMSFHLNEFCLSTALESCMVKLFEPVQIIEFTQNRFGSVEGRGINI